MPSRSSTALSLRQPSYPRAVPARRTLWLDALAVVLIVVATTVAFAPALRADFINWDDDKNITQNEAFRGLSWRHLRWMFTTFHLGPYQPLSWLSLAIDHELGGLQPFGYHLTNVLLHALAAGAFFFLARTLLILARPNSDETGIRLAASVAALLFALHPMRVESVAWVTERRDVLSGLFFVATMHAYLRYAAPGLSTKPARWYALTLASLVLALLSKASTMVAPALMLVVDAWPLRRWSASNHDGRAMRLIVEKIPFFAVAAFFAALAFHGQAAQSGTMKSMAQHGFLERIAQSCYGLMYYPVRAVMPVGLLPIYELPDPFHPFRALFIASAACVACATLALWLLRRRFPAGLTAWMCCALAVAPVLGLTQSGPQLVADRYSYLSSMPLALLAAGAFLSMWHRSAALHWTSCSAAIAALVALGVLTWRYGDKWRDSETLWTYTLDRNPDSYIAWQNLGQVRASQSEATADPAARRAKLVEAQSSFEKGFALRQHPDFLYNLASIHLNLALLEPEREREHQLQAVSCVDRARELYKTRNLPAPETTLQYAEVLLKVGRVDDSIREMQAIARLHPDHLAARLNLGALLLELKRPQEALSHLEAAAGLAPREAAVWSPLARARDALGQRDPAIEAYRRLLRIKSDQLGPAASTDPEYHHVQARLRAMGATP